MTEIDVNERRNGIGGSDIAAICGLSPHRTPLTVYLEKVGEAEEFEGNEATEWGKALEPLVLAKYAAQQGVEVLPGRLVIDSERPWLRGNIDGEVAGHAIGLEVKTAGIVGFPGKAWGAEWTDQIPQAYLCQAHWYMALIPSWECVHVPALIAGRGLQIYSVPRDDAFEQHLLVRASAFWDRVQRRDPPPVDASDECARWLARIHPAKPDALMLESTPAIDALALEYRAAKVAREAAEESEGLLANRLRSLIGEARGVAGEWGRIIWTTGKKRQLRAMFNDETTQEAA